MPLRELRAYMLAVGEPRAYMRAEADWRLMICSNKCPFPILGQNYVQ